MSVQPHNASVRPDGGGGGGSNGGNGSNGNGNGNDSAGETTAPNQQQQQQDDPFQRNAKRRRTEIGTGTGTGTGTGPPVDVAVALRTRMCARFGVAMGGSLWDTARNMTDAVVNNQDNNNDEESLLAAMRFLAESLCVADHTASLNEATTTSADDNDTSASANASASAAAILCTHCSVFNPTTHLARHRERDREGVASIFRAFHAVVTTGSVPLQSPLTVRALVLCRRMALHANTRDLLDYESSDACRWCARQLYSADRGVRTQAAKTLGAYCRERTDGFSEVMDKNRRRFFRGLDLLLQSGDCITQELSALAWTQLGMVVCENQLEPMLCGLLRHLDSEHLPVRNMALAELRYLASWFQRTPAELFEPYWRSTAHLIVQHIAGRPGVADAVANLFGTTAAKLALRLQSQAIPELLFRRQLAPIRAIAALRGDGDGNDGDGDEVWPTIMDKTNLTSILAFWVQLPQAVATLDDLMELLQAFSARMGPATIREVMGVAAIPVLGELFIRLTHEGGRIPDHFGNIAEDGIGFRPILTVAKLLKNDNDSDGNSSKRQSDAEIVIDFLSQHVLGFTTRLSDVRGHDGKKHLCHWIEGIEALELLIKYLRSEIRVARPQVTAFLLDALCTDTAYAACWQVGVRRAAMSCWAALVQNVGDDSVHTLVETTFAVIRRNWGQFGEWERTRCRELFAWLLAGTGTTTVLADKIDVLPQLRVAELHKAVDAKLDRLRKPLGAMQAIDLFAQRIAHENLDVVGVALEDAIAFLQSSHNQDVLLQQAQAPAAQQGEQAGSAVAHFVRALLDCAAKYSASVPAVAADCVTCIGLVGCLDANRLGAVRKAPPFVVVYNFNAADESVAFIMYMLEHVLTRAFLSATNSTSQGMLAYSVQNLLAKCGISAAVRSEGRGGEGRDMRDMRDLYSKWKALPELVQVVLAPLLVSRYHIALPGPVAIRYPIFRAGRTYADWLKILVADLLAKTQNAYGEILYESLARAVKGQDLAVAEFLLPYMVVYVVTGPRSSTQDRDQITRELQRIIAEYQPRDEAPAVEKEQAKLFYDAVFRVIEYALVWLRSCIHYDKPMGVAHIEKFIEAFPAEVLSQKALYCKDYARAMFFLEPVAMASVPDAGADGSDAADAAEAVARRDKAESDLIDIYAAIDDPDCLSGIMSKVGSFVEMTPYRKALLEQKAGRWESATTWHLSDLSTAPDNVDIQARVLKCFLEAGHHDALLARVDQMNVADAPATTINKVLPLAVEAAWATLQWAKLDALVPVYKGGDVTDLFNVGIAHALSQLHRRDVAGFGRTLTAMGERVAASMSYSTTSSLQACHEAMLKAHVMTDLQMISSAKGAATTTDSIEQQQQPPPLPPPRALAAVVQRLDLLQDVSDKRYLLSLHRAAMESLRPVYGDGEISALWLLDARLARKTGSNGECLKAIAHARQLGDPAAEVENAKRQWAWGGKHQAIADLRVALSRGLPGGDAYAKKWSTQEAAPLAARARLLLTRWLDASGETSRLALRDDYRELASKYSEWEKSYYFLGRHYKKVLEAEQALVPDEQSDVYLTGDLARYEIEAYLRAARLGNKYLHMTLPRFLTMWLSLGSQIDRPPEGKAALSDELRKRRADVLSSLHRRLLRQVARLPAYIFYTTLPQLVARINHPNRDVCLVLDQIISKVVQAYPQQALWSVFGVMTTRARPKANQTKKAAERLIKVICAQGQQQQQQQTSASTAGGKLPTLQTMLRRGVSFADELVKVGRRGNYRAHNTTKAVSLTRDMNFNPRDNFPPLVVPIARCLTAALPSRLGADGSGGSGSGSATGSGPVSNSGDPGTSTASASASALPTLDTHNAFSSDVITIQAFEDEVLILGSLAQPRKLTIRGSDGRLYDLLLKPKDDMRTDQRIMEVNAQINQALRKDADATRRELSIRTYAVTPLNEDCGIIEWVLGLKTLREILRPYYDLRRATVQPRPPDPIEIQKMLTEAAQQQKTRGDRQQLVFTQTILPAYPPVLHEWFMRRFPYPAAWFTARLRFTRSVAVMSMTGAVLGLGDRHCENVLVDQDSGGVMHVDFNCLFEKGRLFTQPETVPFRLTQNMRAAMGICDHRGPFRRSCELTLQTMRAQEETLLAVLEAFIHDPTLDLQAEARGAGQQHLAGGAGGAGGSAARAKPPPVVKLDPPSVVKNIQRRINGLLFEETIPLGVEGQAWELIKQATDPANLAAMYIGWAPHW